MKTTLILLVLATAVAFGYPLVNEGTSSSCAALERRALTLATRDGGPESLIVASLARELLQAGNGRLAAEFSRRRNPDVPAAISCTFNYWHSLLDRSWLDNAMRRELR